MQIVSVTNSTVKRILSDASIFRRITIWWIVFRYIQIISTGSNLTNCLMLKIHCYRGKPKIQVNFYYLTFLLYCSKLNNKKVNINLLDATNISRPFKSYGIMYSRRITGNIRRICWSSRAKSKWLYFSFPFSKVLDSTLRGCNTPPWLTTL